MSGRKGFTLVELVAVIVIIGLLYSVGMPIYKRAVIRARESALKENLKVMRKAIDHYYADHLEYPENLEDLVEQRYLRKIPDDPFTGFPDWYMEPSSDEKFDIYDVRSSASGNTPEGESYSDW